MAKNKKSNKTALKYKGATLSKKPNSSDLYIVFTVIALIIALFSVFTLLGLKGQPGSNGTGIFKGELAKDKTYSGASFLSSADGTIGFSYQGKGLTYPLAESYQVFDQSKLPFRASSLEVIAVGTNLVVTVKDGKVTTVYHS